MGVPKPLKENPNTQQAMPVPRNSGGTCPSVYTAQGSVCVSLPHAKPAILRNGTCPSGWVAQGNYCVATHPNPKIVIPRNGTCPSGYTAQGNYCVQA